LFVLDQTTLAALDHRLDNVKTEKRRFDILIAQKRQMELSRDSLLAEIIVIRRIDEDRYVWPHLLDQITKALPPYTWLTGIATIGAAPAGLGPAPPPPAAGAAPAPGDSLGVGTVRISIDGRTVDIEAFTTFLRQLTASPWLAEVAPTNTTTMIEADRPVTQFNVVARYRPADPRYVHTVPLTQSVR
jgi:type IV pilus assembly protein PilN